MTLSVPVGTEKSIALKALDSVPYVWSVVSSDPTVVLVTLNSNGWSLTALAVGTATITITATFGATSKTQADTITVTAAVSPTLACTYN